MGTDAGLRMRGIFKSVCVRVFQQLAHRVTHRIQRFWLLTRSRYAFSTLPALFSFRKNERKKEREKERKKERRRKEVRKEGRKERRNKERKKEKRKIERKS